MRRWRVCTRPVACSRRRCPCSRTASTPAASRHPQEQGPCRRSVPSLCTSSPSGGTRGLEGLVSEGRYTTVLSARMVIFSVQLGPMGLDLVSGSVLTTSPEPLLGARGREIIVRECSGKNEGMTKWSVEGPRALLPRLPQGFTGGGDTASGSSGPGRRGFREDKQVAYL